MCNIFYYIVILFLIKQYDLKRDSWLIRGSFVSRRNAAVHFVFTKLNRYGTGGNEVIKSARYPSCVRTYCHVFYKCTTETIRV